MKEKNLQPRLLYPARISFRFDGEINSFTDKQKLREFSTTKNSFTTKAKGTSLGRKHKRKKRSIKTTPRGFPGGAVVKNPPANAGDMGSSPGLRRSHMLWSD